MFLWASSWKSVTTVSLLDSKVQCISLEWRQIWLREGRWLLVLGRYHVSEQRGWSHARWSLEAATAFVCVWVFSGWSIYGEQVKWKKKRVGVDKHKEWVNVKSECHRERQDKNRQIWHDSFLEDCQILDKQHCRPILIFNYEEKLLGKEQRNLLISVN